VLKITLMIGHMDGSARPLEIARMADAAGLYGIAIGEHVALSDDLENYPYAGGLVHGDGGRKPYLEPAVLHGAFASITSKIRLSHAVMLAPLRPAVLLAKQLASIDVLSGGRCEPVFGTGWSRDEYASLNVDYDARRRILRDNIAACRALWENQPATFKSETVSFEGLYSMPQPVQKRIPILLGVKANEKNAALVAELCDGWESGPDDSHSLEKLREGSRIYRQAFAAAGRDPAELIVRAHLPRFIRDDGRLDLEKTFSHVPARLEAGATEFTLGVSGRLEGPFSSMADIERYLNDLAAFAAKY
jgi:probable F420-dependent oxidoreductase